MITNIRCVYMTCDIPSDCESDPDRRFDLAILQAKERMHTYAIPCQWRMIWDDGERVRLVRESRKSISHLPKPTK